VINYEKVYSISEIDSTIVSETNGKSLDIKISPSVSPIKSQDEIKFKITFLQPNDKVQVHVDYDFTVLHDGDEIFSASKQTGQALLHTAEGTVTIPYSFLSSGLYMVKISVLGINFVPINPESADFTFQVN
jgi:hypothetical protein